MSTDAKGLGSGPLTYLGVPCVHQIPPGTGAVIAGLPLEAGQHAVRVGARLGPRSVREQSHVLRGIDPDTDIDVPQALSLVDVGDLAVPHGDIDGAQSRIFDFASKLFDSGAVPVTIGGDGTVTLPQLRAASRRHPGLAVVHLDAHTDAYPLPGNAGPTAFHRAVENSVLDPKHTFHIGLRGPVAWKGLYRHARELGYTLVTMEELLARSIETVFAEVRQRLEGRPVYVCWDMDFFDPTVVPGAFTPAWGGATAREGLQIAKLLRGLNVVAIDVNTVSPPHDVGGITAFLAARLIFELLTNLAVTQTAP